ncbi:MAG: hypothetical protein HQM12_10200 [SAR324 cluster bacterium]|nr:hypothetical protein [SAR324 cluster bacterium]
MRLENIVEKLVIDPRKLTHYALDMDSPHGQHKAVIFQRFLRFTRENHHLLIQEIRLKALRAEAKFHSQDKFGERYTVDLDIQGIGGKTALVRTGWLISVGQQNEAHLITLYVMK